MRAQKGGSLNAAKNNKEFVCGRGVFCRLFCRVDPGIPADWRNRRLESACRDSANGSRCNVWSTTFSAGKQRNPGSIESARPEPSRTNGAGAVIEPICRRR